MANVGFQAGVKDFVIPGFKELGDFLSISLLLFNSDGESFDTSEEKEGVEG